MNKLKILLRITTIRNTKVYNKYLERKDTNV